jgi:hypothetical protein
MILLMSENPDEIFLNRLNLPMSFPGEHTDWDNVSGLFLDWVPKIPAYEDAWFAQASILQKLIKRDIPIVIYDRSFSLDEKEVRWLNKFNVYLFEPALNSGRSGFRYLPEWISSFDVMDDDNDRFDVIYGHTDLELNIKNFEKWIRDYGRLFPDKKVAYSSKKLSDFKKEEYKSNNLKHLEYNENIFSRGNFTVAIDKDMMYEIGYLNPMYFYAMNLGCLPLLPSKHKYFHGMFDKLVVNDLQEMNFFVSSIKYVKDVVIKEVLDRIKSDWNEFTVEHAVDVIRECYE